MITCCFSLDENGYFCVLIDLLYTCSQAIEHEFFYFGKIQELFIGLIISEKRISLDINVLLNFNTVVKELLAILL